jgi:hypothetical protein
MIACNQLQCFLTLKKVAKNAGCSLGRPLLFLRLTSQSKLKLFIDEESLLLVTLKEIDHAKLC